MTGALQRFDLVADPARFFFGVPKTTDDDLFALIALRPKGFAEPSAVVRDHARGGAEDARGRAIILLEPNDCRAGKIAFEPQDVADLGTAPAVDRLIVVADAAQVSPRLGQ